ncbi:ankyrin repeat-containing domain protein [Phyllosticta citricarpa]
MQFAFTLTSRERLDAYSAKKQTLMESVLCSSWPRSSSPVARATQISFNTSLLVALARNLKERDTEILAAIGIFYQRGAKVNFHGSYEKFTPLLGSLGRLVNIQYHKKGPCVVIKLLEIGADPNLPVPYGENDFEPLGPAFIYGNTETIGILVHAAAVLLRSHFCTESTLKLLLQSNLRNDGFKLRYQKKTDWVPYANASHGGQIASPDVDEVRLQHMKTLMYWGADVNASKGSISALQDLCDRENDAFDSVELLLQRGADPNKYDCGEGPLHLLCFRGNIESIKRLIKWGAGVNDVDRSETPLSRVFEGCTKPTCYQILEYLLDHGADPFRALSAFECSYTELNQAKTSLPRALTS